MTYANRKPITVSKVGHVVLKVISLDTALDFYSGVLGLKEVARRDFGEGPMAFLSAGTKPTCPRCWPSCRSAAGASSSRGAPGWRPGRNPDAMCQRAVRVT